VALFFHHHRLCQVVADRKNAFRESLTRRATRNPDTWRIRRISVIASSQVGEQSFEDDDARNGYFTFYLMQTLKNEGQDSIEKVYAYVRDQVSKNVHENQNAAKSRAQPK
jgi:hypothetical protein